MSSALLTRAVLAALAGAPFVSRASAQAPIQLRISTAAVESDWLSRALVMFKERLEAAAPGQFNVQVHPNGVHEEPRPNGHELFVPSHTFLRGHTPHLLPLSRMEPVAGTRELCPAERIRDRRSIFARHASGSSH